MIEYIGVMNRFFHLRPDGGRAGAVHRTRERDRHPGARPCCKLWLIITDGPNCLVCPRK